MSEEYILEHLLKWAKLFYGDDDTVYSKKKGEYYYFGIKNKKVKLKNQLTKQLAIFICSGTLPNLKKKK